MVGAGCEPNNASERVLVGPVEIDRVAAQAHAAGAHVRVGGVVAQNDDFISAVYGSFPLMVALIALLTVSLTWPAWWARRARAVSKRGRLVIASR